MMMPKPDLPLIDRNPRAEPCELPPTIASCEQLDELLSRPGAATVAALSRLDGDLLILGAGGKMGPTLALMARRAMAAAGLKREVIAVARRPLPELERAGVRTLACDLMDLDAVRRLPQAGNVIFMAGRKFGSAGAESLTWMTNVIVPYHVASTFRGSRIASFSTGCVYPVIDVKSGGASEQTPPDPVGEYAQSCLGRERMFDYYSEHHGEKVVHIRLNYSVEMRYGVLVDIAGKVWNEQPVDVTTGYANVIWQGDACNHILRSLELAASPARVLNVTGPETFSVRQVALEFGRLLDKPVRLAGEENGRAYLSNATQANNLFGNPAVPLGRIIDWTADWIRRGGERLAKPTHFETQDGKY